MIHSLVGTVCSGVGRGHLYDCRGNLSSSDCLALMSSLEQIEREAEPAQLFAYRDRVWEQRAFGWHGQLLQILAEIAVPESELTNSAFLDACNRELAEMRLLRMELAIQAWRATRGRLPESLGEMVPAYLTEIPVDPMAPTAAALQYRQVGDGYLLYSVGHNGIDDGGSPPAAELFPYSGDLRLDVLYAGDP